MTCSSSYNGYNNCGNRLVSSSKQSCRKPFDKSLNKDDKEPFEVFGENSRCFRQKALYGTVCLEYLIKGKELYMLLEGKEKKCSYLDEVHKHRVYGSNNVPKHDLEIRCPDPAHFIDSVQMYTCPKECSFNGFCVKGKCQCFYNYGGEDCSQENSNSIEFYNTTFTKQLK